MSLIFALGRLLARAGEPAIVRRKESLGGEPWAPELQLTDFPVTAVLRRVGLREVGAPADRGSWEARIAADELPLTPDPASDCLVVAGREYAILAVETRRTQAAALLHVLTLRG